MRLMQGLKAYLLNKRAKTEHKKLLYDSSWRSEVNRMLISQVGDYHAKEYLDCILSPEGMLQRHWKGGEYQALKEHW